VVLNNLLVVLCTFFNKIIARQLCGYLLGAMARCIGCREVQDNPKIEIKSAGVDNAIAEFYRSWLPMTVLMQQTIAEHCCQFLYF